jgi:3-oxoacyl-[acyl-carrier-protein] synthase II
MAGSVNSADSVVVSGIGTVSAAGVGLDALRDQLREGRPRLADVDRSAGFHVDGSARRAALVGELSIHDWIPPLVARRMSKLSKYSLVAARTALDAAGLEVPPEPDPSVAVAVSTAFGPTAYSQRLLDQMAEHGPPAASPSVFTECVANAPAAQIGIHCRARGCNHTLVGREVGPLMAIDRGVAEVRGGARVALAGAVEEIPPLVHSILDRFRALARPGPDGLEVARPFDRYRNGLLAAEGSTMLVLEREETARERNTQILARVRGCFGGFDPSASRAGWGNGADILANRLLGGLQRCGLEPKDIDVVVSGASGSRAGDRLEAWTIQRAWKEQALPPVLAPKSVTGEYSGVFLAAAVLTVLDGSYPAVAGFSDPDPELRLVPYDGSPMPPARRALVSSLGSGGAAEWLVLERV